MSSIISLKNSDNTLTAEQIINAGVLQYIADNITVPQVAKGSLLLNGKSDISDGGKARYRFISAGTIIDRKTNFDNQLAGAVARETAITDEFIVDIVREQTKTAQFDEEDFDLIGDPSLMEKVIASIGEVVVQKIELEYYNAVYAGAEASVTGTKTGTRAITANTDAIKIVAATDFTTEAGRKSILEKLDASIYSLTNTKVKGLNRAKFKRKNMIMVISERFKNLLRKENLLFLNDTAKDAFANGYTGNYDGIEMIMSDFAFEGEMEGVDVILTIKGVTPAPFGAGKKSVKIKETEDGSFQLVTYSFNRGAGCAVPEAVYVLETGTVAATKK